MNFSADRDLLPYEPTVFNDVPYVGQQRLGVSDVAFDGTVVTSASADFTAAGIESADVVLIADIPHEVIARNDANTLTVSLLRTRLGDAVVPGTAGTDLELIARTFAPQATLVHEHLLTLMGIGDPGSDLNEDAIVSLSVMARLETLGTLERVYSGAAALIGDNATLLHKAKTYRDRFRRSLRGATVLIDTDGDGHADARRCPGVVRLQRV